MLYLLPERDDFLGANFVTILGAFIYAKFFSLTTIYNNSFEYYKSMYLKPVTYFSTEITKINENDINYKENLGNEHRTNQAIPVIKLESDLITHFKYNYKERFYNIILNISKERNYKLPWNDNNNIICIHLRLYDDRNHEASNYQDYDGSGSSDYIKELIENNNFDNYKKTDMINYCRKMNINWGALSHPDKQVAIDINKFNNIIIDLKNKYPEKEIHVITKLSKNPNNKKYIDLCNKYNITLHSNDDCDYDLWLLIHCDILVLSKSTYSLIAGYYHQGSKVIYPLWGTFASCGLNTKYDRSGWESYI